jgi:hypothetical protein
MNGTSRHAILALLVAALSGCKETRTEMLVTLANNGVAVPDQADVARIFVRDHTSGDTTYSSSQMPLCTGGQTAACLALPTALTLYPGSQGPRDIVEVEVQALLRGTVVIDDAATFTFAAGQSQHLDFILYPSCINTMCAQNSTMRSCAASGQCADITPMPLQGEPDFGIPSGAPDMSAHVCVFGGDNFGNGCTFGP